MERLFLADERRDEQRGDLKIIIVVKYRVVERKRTNLIAPPFSDGETCTEKKEDIL